MGLKIYFTKNQFLKYYMNVGSSYVSLNRNNSYYLLGIYNKFSLINLNLFIFKLKKSINFLISIFIKNNFLNILVVNTINNKFVNKIYFKQFTKLKVSYFVNTWWNGLLKNFKKFTKYKNKKKRQYYFYKDLLPFSVLYINQEKHFKKDLSTQNFHNEANSASIFSLIFANTTVNSYNSPNIFFQNTRNLINNFFINNLFIKIIKKIIFSLKKKFCFFVFKNFKIFNVKKQNLNIFFEFFFCNIYKKNYLKNTKWLGDLE